MAESSIIEYLNPSTISQRHCESNSTCCANASPLGVASSTFASALQIMWTASCTITEDWPEEALVADGEYFDFIIAGAGTAGCIVANRLSENKDWNILLIDAGGIPPVESIIPYFIPHFYKTLEYNWNFVTEKNPNIGQAYINGSILDYTQGKILGGGSSINGMTYFKGLDYDYQQWYDLGNKEWHPSITRQYSKKAECLQVENYLKNFNISKNFGKNGPMPINTFATNDKTANILSAFDEIGIKWVDDLTSANLMGAGVLTATVAEGKRESTAKAYLNPIRSRHNLRILTNTLVTKLLINHESKKAYGVEVKRQGQTERYYSTKEVIVSTGAINTPKLLMLSGIGPQEVLESHDIDCLVNSPGVGQNLQDHVYALVTIYTDDPNTDAETDKAFDAVQYIYNHSGKFSVPSMVVNPFYSLNENATYPDFQSFIAFISKNSSDLLYITKQFKTSVAESILENAAKHALYMFRVVILHPFSKGYVTLKSSDPRDPPIINPNYLKDSRDLEMLAHGCQRITKIIDTTHFKSINAYVGRVKLGLCDGFELNSFGYWKCISRSTAKPGLHPVGTAKMGLRSDPEAVVDSRLRVYGEKGLRVVDASVMPLVPSCNTNGPTIMVGERASDLIKEDHEREIRNPEPNFSVNFISSASKYETQCLL